ncbi:MAG: putative transcriptional regulator [Bradyrhizobium sp.]|nr:putative transcriptional regulator [Bradyrhizobium sp.]
MASAAVRGAVCEASPVLSFDRFRVSAEDLTLYRDASPLRISARAVQVLLALIERQGEVVSHQELLRIVWHGVFVEESNLRVHIYALRKALNERQSGKRYVFNVPGRGYRFAGDVELRTLDVGAMGGLAEAAPEALIGQSGFVERVLAGLEQDRFVTLVGTAGIGKTSVARAVGDIWTRGYAAEVVFVDLAAVSSPAMVSAAASIVLGLPALYPDMTAGIVRIVGKRKLLLILDNCEHVIEEAVRLADALHAGAQEVRLLATSRQAPRSSSGRVLRVPALGFPDGETAVTLENAGDFPAIQLFAAAANAADDGFELNAANCPHVGSICRRLDGIPLAIELAAAQATVLGAERLDAELSDKMLLLSRPRRAGLPRHRTLFAALGWSYGLLSRQEQAALQSFALFAARFDLHAALAATADLGLTEHGALELICDLAEKSLMTVEADGDTISYRLLATTRAFLLEKAQTGGRLAAAREAHARYFLGRLRALRDEQSLDAIGRAPGLMPDVRSALDWCFEADRDLELGVQLTASAAIFWLKLLLMQEHHAYLVRATDIRAERPDLDLPTEDEIALYFILAQSWYYRGGVCPEINQALTHGLLVAEASGNVPAQIKGTWLGYAFFANDGLYRAEFERAERYRQLVEGSGDPFTEFIAYRMHGRAHHDLGEQATARQFLDRALAVARSSSARMTSYDVEIDMWTAAKGTLARTLWIQGLPDQARAMARASLAEAGDLDHATSMCWTLAFNICPVDFWCGDMELAQGHIRLLMERSRRIAGHWLDWGEMYLAALDAYRSGREFVVDCSKIKTSRAQFDIFATLPIRVPSDFIGRLDTGEVNWALPEILRRHATRQLREGRPEADLAAEELLGRAGLLAADQGALGWELRIATTLAEHRIGHGRLDEGRAALEPVVRRFGEGFDTIDLQRAAALLSSAGG